MKQDREYVYRGMVALFACALYNGEEGWDRQAVISQLRMGDPRYDYALLDDPPGKLTDEDVFRALDAIFDRAGI